MDHMDGSILERQGGPPFDAFEFLEFPRRRSQSTHTPMTRNETPSGMNALLSSY
jgi:hypothetical protein